MIWPRDRSAVEPTKTRPKIRKISGHIAMLDRMRKRREDTIKTGRGSPGSLAFFREEHAALCVALDALRYHQVAVRDETSPVVVLRELLAEIGRLELVRPIDLHDDLAILISKARRILQEVST